MASGKGGGPIRTILSMAATLIMVGVLVVALVSSGGWKAVVPMLGTGDADAHTSDLTQGKGDVPRNPNAKPLDEWWKQLSAGSSGGQSAGSSGGQSAGSSGGQSADTSGGQSTGASVAKPSDKTPGQSVVKPYADALVMLDTIRVTRPHLAGYDREREFGGWASNGCGKATTRDTILARDLKQVVKDKDCRVTSGLLHDPYTGRSIRFTRGRDTSGLVQIDHVVALQDAWASGAYAWPQSKRVAYANDPFVLLASDGKANMAKGAGLDFNNRSTWLEQHTKSPNIWMPSNTAYQCDYMSKRVAIKHRYGLTMTDREKSESTATLAACAAGR